MSMLDTIAERLGQAIGTFRYALRQALRGHRPGFFAAMAEQGKWEGGWQWGNEREAQRRAITNSWIFGTISTFARDCSAARLQVVEHRGADDEPVQIHNHALEKLIRYPNPYMGRSFLWQYSYWWLKLDGNFYWFVLCDDEGRGKPIELWPLPAFAVRPWPGDGDRLIDYYEYDVGGRVYRIPAEYVVHVKQPNPFSLYTGLSELVAAMLPSDGDTAMARWNAAFFGKQNTMPSAIINLSSGDPNAPINPTDAEKLKADLSDDYAAYDRRALVTTANSVSATLLGWNAKDMDFLAGREFTKEEIQFIFGRPAGMMDKNATEANAVVAERRWFDTLWGALVLVAEQLTVELVRPFYGWWPEAANLEAQFEDIRPKNRELELHERDAARGILTVDEIRQRYFALDPLPEERGAVLETEMQAPALGDYGVPDFNLADVQIPQQALSQAIESDLRKWQTKAQRALKRDGSADVDFESAVLPGEVVGHVRIHLQAARSGEDVRAAFVEVAALRPFPVGAS